MKPLYSWMYPSDPSTAESPPSLETCSSVGTRLGNFLASVHCDAALLLKSQTLTDDGKPWFENPDTKDLVRDQVVGRVLPILQPWIDPETGRTEKIAKIISQDFEHGFLENLLSSSPPSSVLQSMFSTGDLWTGSIIVDASPATSGFGAITEVGVGLIDWEFATPARIGQDIAQLSAWLYLLSTSSAWSSPESHCRHTVEDAITILAKPVTGGMLGWWSAAGTLTDALLKAYALKVKEYPDYAWFVDEDYDQHRLKKERLAVIRSIWILFGREVIFGSVEAKVKFAGFFTVDGDGGEGEEEVKMWQREMIEVGYRYVSVAGESSDEEFEVAVRKESVLKRLYTVSGSL